jgi:hypothetical protein
MPTYFDVPLATQSGAASQSQIRTNFTSINTALSVNHVSIDAASNWGEHSKVDFVNSATHPLVSGTNVLLYNYLSPLTGVQELYFKKAGPLGTAGTPITSKGAATNGWTYLPSGILLRWGTQAGQNDFSITKNDAPFFTQIFNVQVTGRTDDLSTNNKTIVLRTWTLNPGTSFTLNVTGVQRLGNNAAMTTCHWFVIGV